MSRAVKLGLYVVCVLGVIIFGTLTLRAYRDAAKASEERKERLGEVETTNAPTATTTTTNTHPVDAVTNAPVDAAVAPGEAGDTNAAAAGATNAAVSTNAPHPGKDHEGAEMTSRAGVATRSYTRMVTYGLGLFLSVIGLGVLIAYDVTHAVAQKAQEALFRDDGQPADPEYEQAEKLWTNGQYLDAVRAMREYLDKNPREQHVALRIAEIYEENLNNPLAAALEYEEVLKKKLPAERWGWAAIHLANIYSGKLNKPDKAIELLRRIDAEYGQTAAAKKARERLTQIDPDFVPTPQPTTQEEAPPAEEERPSKPAKPSNLPPGFRPKS